MTGANNQDFRSIPPLWPSLEGQRALDLGCGRGLYTWELARRGAWAVGLDPDFDSLLAARREADGRAVHWVRAEGAHLPFKTGRFAVVVSVEVLTHMPPHERREALSEIRRVSGAPGLGFVTLHNRVRLAMGQWLRLRRPRQVYDTSHLRVWPVDPVQARAMMADCGLQVLGGVRYMNYHSRFSYRFFTAHPRLSALVVLLEEVLCRLPGLRRLGITFLLCLQRQDPDRDSAGMSHR